MANYFSKQFEANDNTAKDQFGKINDQTANTINEQHQLAGGFGQEAENAYNFGNGGLQGYTPQQQSDILGLDANGQPTLGLSHDEQMQMAGNPGQVETNVAQGTSDLQTGANQASKNISDLGQHNAGAIIGAVDPSKFNPSAGYTGAVQGALGKEGTDLGSAVNNPNLGLSGDFNSNYNFTPADQQRIVTQAGSSIGNRYAATEDQVQRAANAAGTTSPIALAASMGRLNRESSAQQGDAMNAAQIAAKNEALGVTQAKEQMRLGTAQDISSRQMQAGEVLGTAGVNAANTGEQLRLSGQGQAQNLGLSAQNSAANQVTNTAEYGANTQLDAAKYGIGANATAQTGADAASTARAAAIAGNRQATNTTMSNRYTGVANDQQSQQGKYQDYVTGQEGQATTAGLTAQGQQTTAAAAGANASNQATTGAYNSGNQPGLASKIAGAVGAAAGAASKGFAGFADGGTVVGDPNQDPSQDPSYGGGEQIDWRNPVARASRYGQVMKGIEGAMGPGPSTGGVSNTGEAQQQQNLNSLGSGLGSLGGVIANSFKQPAAMAFGGTVAGTSPIIPSLPGGTSGSAPPEPPNASGGFRRYSPVGPQSPKVTLQPKPEEMAHHLPSKVRISPRLNVRLPRPAMKSAGHVSLKGRY